ncbi:MAG: DNA polymerase III subunit beta, partial [Anaerolineae bacterium]|nr:DNA polymerase III subunit beta [Anaerolineae bacterium]
LFSRDSNNMVRFQIAPGANGAPGMLTMTSQSSESGDNLANLDVAVEGPEAEIAFNGRYVIDLLNVVDHPQITLETTRASAPGVVRPVGVGPDEFTCVVMPMHLNR